MKCRRVLNMSRTSQLTASNFARGKVDCRSADLSGFKNSNYVQHCCPDKTKVLQPAFPIPALSLPSFQGGFEECTAETQGCADASPSCSPPPCFGGEQRRRTTPANLSPEWEPVPTISTASIMRTSASMVILGFRPNLLGSLGI